MVFAGLSKLIAFASLLFINDGLRYCGRVMEVGVGAKVTDLGASKGRAQIL
jgi:hypothetical protein